MNFSSYRLFLVLLNGYPYALTSAECRIMDGGCALRRFLDLFCNRWTSLAVNALARE